MISIHSPRAGRDILVHREALGLTPFQSTRPVRGETIASTMSPKFLIISIHSPRAGRDGHGQTSAALHLRFQSTRPVRGETDKLTRPSMISSISIHSPRAGRDHTYTKPKLPDNHFNPLAPCGARLCLLRKFCAKREFQSTRPVRGETNRRGVRCFAADISIHSPRAGRDLLDA